MKIAVITDLHYAKEKNIACPGRAGERAKELLNAAIEKLNTEIKPDILLVGGDLVNKTDDAPLLEELAEIFRKLPYPQLIIPGNHDPAPDVFYQFFPHPPEYLDLQGIRFLAFPDDQNTEGYNARRTPEDLERMQKLSAEKPTVLLQHVPLYKRNTIPCFYNFDNVEEIMEHCGNVVLAVCGHEHTGFQPSYDSPFPVLIVPALCEGTFPFAVIELSPEGLLQSYKIQYVTKD